MFPKIDFDLCYTHLFLVFLRPSFGACAPPSPNLAFITYNFLRRVGRLHTVTHMLRLKSAKWEDFKPFRFNYQEKTSISRQVGRLQTFSPQLSRKNKYFPPSGKTSFLIFEFYVFFAECLFNFVHILFKLRFLLRHIDGFQNFDVVIAHRFNYF